MAKCKAAGGEVKKEAEEKKDTFKRGGKVGKKLGKVAGKKPGMRPDKKARGGMAQKVTSAAGMSASSPLSGAGKTTESKSPKNDKEDD